MAASNKKQEERTKIQEADCLKSVLKEGIAKLLEILGMQTGKPVQKASDEHIEQTSLIFRLQ